MNPSHPLFDFDTYNGSMMLLIFIPVFFFGHFFDCCLQKLLYCCRLAKKLSYVDSEWNFTISINEKLGHYWQAINGLD